MQRQRLQTMTERIVRSKMETIAGTKSEIEMMPEAKTEMESDIQTEA